MRRTIWGRPRSAHRFREWGETVDTDEITGPVTALTHAMETIGTHVVYHVDIEVAADAGSRAADADDFDRPIR